MRATTDVATYAVKIPMTPKGVEQWGKRLLHADTAHGAWKLKEFFGQTAIRDITPTLVEKFV